MQAGQTKQSLILDQRTNINLSLQFFGKQIIEIIPCPYRIGNLQVDSLKATETSVITLIVWRLMSLFLSETSPQPPTQRLILSHSTGRPGSMAEEMQEVT